MTAAMILPCLAANAPDTSHRAPASAATASRPAWAAMKVGMAWLLPVQYDRRIMPLDSMARQVVRDVTGLSRYGTYDCTALLLAWTWQWSEWADEPMVLVDDPDLQAQIGLPLDQKRFAYAVLASNHALAQLAGQAADLDASHQPIRPSQLAAAGVWNRLSMLESVSRGELLRIVPAMQNADGPWTTIDRIDEQEGISPSQQETILRTWAQMRQSFSAGDAKTFNAAARDLPKTLAGLKAAGWPKDDRVGLEVVYNLVRPFRAGWVAMAVTMLVGVPAALWPRRWLWWIAWALLLDAFGLLSLGIMLRYKFGGHIPVATPYESLVFLGWAITALGVVTLLRTRQRALLPTVAAAVTAILVIADTAGLPTVARALTSSPHTAWLTCQTVTGLVACGSLVLAMCMGCVLAGSRALRTQEGRLRQTMDRWLYGLIAAGCILLAVAIPCAIRANGAWGVRPGAAMATLLVYGTILLSRRQNWLSPFGTAMACILCFPLVGLACLAVGLESI
jgi:hypothetical protein